VRVYRKLLKKRSGAPQARPHPTQQLAAWLARRNLGAGGTVANKASQNSRSPNPVDIFFSYWVQIGNADSSLFCSKFIGAH